MNAIIAALVTALFVAAAGIYLMALKREKDGVALLQRHQEEEQYLEAQRQRMKLDRVAFMKEIEQITKTRHPDSSRHQRRTVAALYKSQIKSS